MDGRGHRDRLGDGALARAARVKDRLPTFNGARLDDIVDYLTFVFAPAYLVYHARLVPDGTSLVVVAAMLLSSAYGFSQEAAKTSDYFFTGFPSYWNIVVFYLMVVAAQPLVSAAVLLTLAVLVFVPIAYVYPSRTPTLRTPTIALGLAWAVLVLVMVWQFRCAAGGALPVVRVSRVLPVLSLVLDARRRAGAPGERAAGRAAGAATCPDCEPGTPAARRRRV